jgi:hypothetical protein
MTTDAAECLGALPTLRSALASLDSGDRMRLYLVDLPGGSARILFVATETSFDRVVESAEPILQSIEFHAS